MSTRTERHAHIDDLHGERILQFQGRSIRQRNVIDQLLCAFKLHANAWMEKAHEDGSALCHRLFHDPVTHRPAMATFERFYRN